MTLLVDSPAVARRFDAICTALAAERRGLTMKQLGTAHALARALEAEDRDEEQVEELAARLGINLEGLR